MAKTRFAGLASSGDEGGDFGGVFDAGGGFYARGDIDLPPIGQAHRFGDVVRS